MSNQSYEVNPAVKGDSFYAHLNEARNTHPEGSFLTVNNRSYYSDQTNRLFMTPTRKAGVGVDKNGYMFGMWTLGAQVKDVLDLLGEASKYGRILDCFDYKGKLPNLYSLFGFIPVARIAFDPALAPQGWDYAKFGRPDVVIMAKPSEPSGRFDYNKCREYVPYMSFDDAIAAAEATAPRRLGRTCEEVNALVGQAMRDAR